MLLGIQIQAQEFKVSSASAKQVIIKGLKGKITVEEYSGKEVVLSVDEMEEMPEKAKGLKSLYQSSAKDNTGIGLMTSEVGDKIEIMGASRRSEDASYLFKIPKGMALKIDYKMPMTEDHISVNGFSGELEITTLNDDIRAQNVTGPLVLYSVNGDITVKFTDVNQSSPISVTAVNGEIDVDLPANTPANIKMGTINGELFTNFDIDFEKKKKNGLSYIGGGQDIDGTINNGGVEIMLKAINDNIYLRKK